MQELFEEYNLNQDAFFNLPESFDKDLMDKLSDLVKNICKKTISKSIPLLCYVEETTPFQSKAGGQAYLPKGFKYPLNKETNKPLAFLAQLNLSEFNNLNKLEYFNEIPQEGLIQFFIDTDDINGLDLDNQTSQDSFRVVYHNKVDENLHSPGDFEDIFPVEIPKHFPIKAEFGIYPLELKEEVIGSCDYRFNNILLEEWNRVFKSDYKALSEINLETYIYDFLYGAFYHSDTDHKIGGYPFFTQTDIRSDYDNYCGYDILLFQLDSELKDEPAVFWGDKGVGNFFITQEQLRDLDFSKVLYNWDCL